MAGECRATVRRSGFRPDQRGVERGWRADAHLGRPFSWSGKGDDNAWVRDLSWSRYGKWIAGGYSGGRIGVWKWGEDDPAKWLAGHQGEVFGVAWSPDGKLLASAGEDGAVRIWNWQDSDESRLLEGQAGVARCVDWSPDGRWVATGGNDGRVRIWETGTGALQSTLKGHQHWLNRCAGTRTDSGWPARQRIKPSWFGHLPMECPN